MYHFNVHLEIEFKLAFRDLRRHMVNDHFYYEFYGRRQKTEHKTRTKPRLGLLLRLINNKNQNMIA